eukprot:scaffold67023_cov45-Attheya_sp.AAC.1
MMFRLIVCTASIARARAWSPTRNAQLQPLWRHHEPRTHRSLSCPYSTAGADHTVNKSANSIRRVPEKDAKKYNSRCVTLSSLFSAQCDDDNDDDKEDIVGTMEALKALKVPELKDRLRARGLKVGGNKSDLIDRLIMSSPRSNN